MTIDTDLATLREACTGWPQPNAYDAALDRVETELARLQEGLRRTEEVLTAAETIVSRKRFDLDPEVRSLRIPIRDARHRALLADTPDGARCPEMNPNSTAEDQCERPCGHTGDHVSVSHSGIVNIYPSKWNNEGGAV